MIYIYYTYISYIIIYRIYSRHKVSLTWDLKPITLDLCSDTCSAELAGLTQEPSIQSMFTQKVTSKNQSCAWMLGTEQVWLNLYVLSISTIAPHYFNFNLWTSSVALLTFSLRLIMNCDQAEEMYMIFITVLCVFGSRYNANLKCDLYLKKKRFIIKWKSSLNINKAWLFYCFIFNDCLSDNRNNFIFL